MQEDQARGYPGEIEQELHADAARRIAFGMAERHAFPMLDDGDIDLLQKKLAFRLMMFSGAKEVQKQATPLEEAGQAMALLNAIAEVRRLADDPALTTLKRHLSEDIGSHPEHRSLRIDQWLDQTRTIGEYVSVIAKATPPGRVRGIDPETVWLGDVLPGLYNSFYPGKPMGGSVHGSNERAGPGYTFIQLAAIELRIGRHISGQRIHGARKTMKAAIAKQSAGQNSGG